MRNTASSGVVRLAFCLCAAAVLACNGGSTPTEPGPVLVSAAQTVSQGETATQGEATSPRTGLRGERLAAAEGAAPRQRLEREEAARPAGIPMAPIAAQEALDSAAGEGNGHGNGGNGNGGNGNGGRGGRGGQGGETFDAAKLSLRIAPDKWNTNYEHAAGGVTAFATGPGLGFIDRRSLELLGDDPAAAPLAARSARIEGKHLRAQFPKTGVLDLLDNATPGTTHTVRLRFTAEGASGPVELSAQIMVIGPAGGGGGETPTEVKLSLRIQPDAWNTNWRRSAGTVVAKISGPGFRKIDLDSVVLVGTDTAAGEVMPRRVQRVGNHVQAFFGKTEAFASLKEPAPGDVHTMTVRFTVEGAAQELTAEIRVVGPAL